MNLTLTNALVCNDSSKENISSFFKGYFKGIKDISANGQCFGQNNGNKCTVIECLEENNSSFVSLTIEDKVMNKSLPVGKKSTVVDLFTVYNSTSFKDIEERLLTFLNDTLKNTFKLNTVESSVEQRCPTGLFLFVKAGDIGHPLCSKCPAGTFYRAFKCEKCPKGTFSLEGSVNCSLGENPSTPTFKDSCEIYCPVGKGLDLKTGFCQWCSNETYQNRTDVPKVNCSPCPKGKRTPYPEATGVAKCYVPCQEGTFFSLNDEKCLPCPLGTYQVARNHLHLKCSNCSQGMITYSNGRTDPSQCVPSCKKGLYLDSKASQCLKCPLGSYQDKINKLNCTHCSVGKSTLKNGSSEQKDCIKTCQIGTYFDVQNSSCSECPKGTYMDQNGHLALSCIKCPGNKTTQEKSAENKTQCLDKCGVGEYFNVQNASCTKCPLGTYMDQKGHFQPSCVECAKNKTTHVQGAGHENHCVHRCNPGEFFVPQNGSCSKCPSGTYMNESNHLITTCKNCGVNQTTQDEGAVDKKHCFNKCGTGEYFSIKNSSCALCPLGFYMDESGHLRVSCKKCGEKKTTYKKGTVNEIQCMDECSTGNYFNSTVSSCVQCPKGFYQSNKAQEMCLPCPPGMSTRSLGETSKLACVKFICGRGEYIDSTDKCQLCPNGTYQSAVNHTLSSCQQCPSKMSKVQGAKNLDACVKICDSFPCENGAECIEKPDDYCRCPQGVKGKRCEVIENQEELIKLEMSVRFTSLIWSEKLGDKKSSEHRRVRYRIENSLRGVFIEDETFVGVQVNELVKGSVIANFDLYMNDNASEIPAKTLQIAVRNGSIGGLPVDARSLNIKAMACDRPLGMENRKIKDGQITASSDSEGQEASRARLNSAKGWLAKEVTSENYVQVRFHRNVNITAIATQGDAVSSYVTAYSLSFSKDGDVWVSLDKNFTANNDTNTIIKNILPEPITSVKYIQVIPVTWNNGIGMRVEFYGCISDPVLRPEEIPTTVRVTVAPTPKMTEPKVKAVASKDNEYSWGKYLGITFGLLMVVGCLIAFFMWWRSSKKKQQREKTPLVMNRIEGGGYKVIDKNDELEYDEHAV